jgi:serine/threonine-protein kinase
VARAGVEGAAIDPLRWERIQALFHAAADLPDPEREAFLQRECAEDSSLRTQVAALLEQDAHGSSVLDLGLPKVASEVLRTSAATLPHDAFGPYHIVRALGEGGMGVVYLAERSDLGSVAAIKILRDAWLSPARRDRFASEQRTLAHLHHPSIAQLYDADALPDGTPWFVMEYVEGVPLTDYCWTKRCTIPERLHLFRAVCEAVQHAHQHLIIHRDLKPSNILVKPDGTVKLLDFGIAKQLDSLDVPVDQTRTGLRLMTPAYAAPEQVRAGRVGIHTDVYSLGVILYELLAGRLPFDIADRSPREIEIIITEQEPERPSAAARAVVDTPGGTSRRESASATSWADLDVLCLTAMHKDPARRYLTVEALVRDVDHYLMGQPLEARPDTIGYRLGKFVRRNRARVIGALVAFTIVVGLVVFYTVRLATARNAALAEAARTGRILRFTQNLFEGGDETAGPAESLRVMTLIDRGLQEARSLDAEPAVQAELYETLGRIYQKLGNFAQSDTLLQAALGSRRVLFGTGSAEVVGSLLALGELRSDQARFEEAEQLVREAIDDAKRHLPPGHPSIAQATFALGSILQERGEYDQAIQVTEEAVRLYSTPKAAVTPELASSLGQLADDHFYAGHYEVADSLNQRVLAMNRELYGEHHPRVADVLINLGASQFDRGYYEEAERYDRQALDIIQRYYGDDRAQTADGLTQLGRALVAQKRFDEAKTDLQKALAIRERVFGPVHPMVASTLNELGNIALARDSLDEAQAAFSRMVDIYRQVYGPKHYLNGIALSNLASVYLDRKEYPRAEQLYRQVIALYTEVLEPDHINTGIAHIKLGRALLRQRRFAEATVESRVGYDILIKQASPAVSFLRAARRDLVAAYDTLGQPEKAARFRAELADTTVTPRSN